MDGQDGSSGAKQQKGDTDRVTLKKEIGLLSACTIIIGEEALFCRCTCLRANFTGFDLVNNKKQNVSEEERGTPRWGACEGTSEGVEVLTWLKYNKSRSRLVVKQKNIVCWSRMSSGDL